MNKFALALIGVLGVTTVFAQQDVKYSQFIFNKLSFNPAYAGSKEALTLASIYRYQWEGIDNAPRTLNVQAHTPFANNRNGVGLSLTTDKIGLTQNSMVDFSYAYRIPFRNQSTLSLGVSLSYQFLQFRASQIQIIDAGDNFIPESDSRSNLNFGFGAYYSSSQFYVGFSVPQLVDGPLYTSDLFDLGNFSRFRTYYLMAGVAIPLRNNILFKPAVLFSFIPNAPFEMDINASFLLMEALWVGGSYRLGDSMDAVVQYQFTKQFKAGVALDFTVSELQKYTAGSVELMIEYIFSFEKDGVHNIRFF